MRLAGEAAAGAQDLDDLVTEADVVLVARADVGAGEHFGAQAVLSCSGPIQRHDLEPLGADRDGDGRIDLGFAARCRP